MRPIVSFRTDSVQNRVCCVCLAIEVTWEDQQRGVNGSLSDGGAQPYPSLTDTGWLVWVWISASLKAVCHFDRVLGHPVLFYNTSK